MTRNLISEIARTRHENILMAAKSLVEAPVGGSQTHVCDAAEKVPAHRKGDCALVLTHSDQAGASHISGTAMQLAYDPADTQSARPAIRAAMTPEGMPIAADVSSQALLTLAQRIARSDIPVLVQGPSGTGKEVLARFLHAHSERSDMPFLALNCAAMPEAMLETMLFGHRKGAFTGATEAHEGFFRAADGGTLLLDEIGEMPLALQAKLLRVLQEGEVVPIGATQPRKVNVRIVACTNRDLAAEVAQGRFREDLFYRLNVFPIAVPALRERPGDLAALAFGMLFKHGCRAGQPGWLAPDALVKLAGHVWPGNVRELENVIRRAILLAGESAAIAAEHIHFDAAVSVAAGTTERAPVNAVDLAPPMSAEGTSSEASLSDIAFQSEARAILRTLDECGGHRGKTAKQLGISERTLRYRLANMRESGLAIAGARA